MPWHRQIEKYRLKFTQTPSIPTPTKIERRKTTAEKKTERTEQKTQLIYENLIFHVLYQIFCPSRKPPHLRHFLLILFQFFSLYITLCLFEKFCSRASTFFFLSIFRFYFVAASNKNENEKRSTAEDAAFVRSPPKSDKRNGNASPPCVALQYLMTSCWRSKRGDLYGGAKRQKLKSARHQCIT